MIMIYFSGTGNTEYIAKSFADKMKITAYSIEENQDFEFLIRANKLIAFAYPIYGGTVPRIMREFVYKYMGVLRGKNLIVFCTQLMFSGDGARAFDDLFPKDYVKFVYGEHFNMPNNICNAPVFKVTNGEENQKYLVNAEKKMEKTCKNIRNNYSVKRGFNVVSKGLGLTQSSSFPRVEKIKKSSAKTDKDCNGCGLCVKICPMNNLSLENNRIVQHDNCTLCYRCVNKCPQKAITILFDCKPINQYKGVKYKK